MRWIPDMPFDYGVSFFFVLSGFILTYSYGEMRNLAQAKTFYLARIARIWPLHITTIFLCMALLPKQAWMVGGTLESWREIAAANVFLIHAWIPKVAFFFSLNAVAWSISAELFFYLMFPLLRYQLEKNWKLKFIIILLISSAIISGTAHFNVPEVDMAKPFAVSSEGLVYISPFVRIFEFFLGMAFAQLFDRQKILSNCGFAIATLLELTAFALVPLAWLATPALAGLLQSGSEGHAWAVYLAHSGASWAFGVLIYIIAFNRGLISKMLSTRTLVVLGEGSFALYLVHQIFVSAYYIHKPALSWMPGWLQAALYIAVSIGFALGLWHLIENPCRIWIRQFFGKAAAPHKLA